MTLANAAIVLSGVGVLVTAWLALTFLRDPARGLVQTTHRLEQLPQVMTDRYIAFAWLALFATLYRDMAVIAAVFAAFTFMALADAWIYARAGHATNKHIAAGVASGVVVASALLALGGR